MAQLIEAITDTTLRTVERHGPIVCLVVLGLVAGAVALRLLYRVLGGR